MRKLFLAMVSIFFLLTPGRADEGMWLPIYLKLIQGDMESLGARITPEDIYSINESSIKDAIVQLGRFCTGEIVSAKGLVFTNHHCGYDAIAELSSTKNNYLDDGFWASSYEEEMPVEGLTMKILDRMVDVTDLIKGATDAEAMIDSLEEVASEGGIFSTQVFDMFAGTEHYLMVYKVYKDIRFVGAPQAAIGKFGGDTDNWMWPRHTGDFSVFRIYAGPDNEPAEYSENNQPYIPEHFLKISLKGYEEGDFSFIMGYPGSTDRYLTAAGAEQTVTQTYPLFAKLLDARLKIMKKYMDQDDAIRIDMASSYASLANSHKYFKGVAERATTSDFIDQKELYEVKFNNWAADNEELVEKYGTTIEELAAMYDETADMSEMSAYLNFAGFGPAMIMYGLDFWRMQRQITEDSDFEENPALLERLKAATEDHFAEYYPAVDEEITAKTMALLYEGLPEDKRPDIFTSPEFEKYAGDELDFQAFASRIFKKSLLTNPNKAEKWLKKPSLEKLEKDLGYQYFQSIIGTYMGGMMALQMSAAKEESLMGDYLTGMREMEPNRKFYPDANSSLRFTYGTIKPYPNDEGEMYNYFTTADQILEKYVEGDEEFDVPDELLELIRNEDFGRYGEDGNLVVNFLSNTDITGGNSGSPIMDADGHLIGIAFDGNWESMLSDLYFDESVTRTINVDIRYVLFIIDKMANAEHIMNELVIADARASMDEQPLIEEDPTLDIEDEYGKVVKIINGENVYKMEENGETYYYVVRDNKKFQLLGTDTE